MEKQMTGYPSIDKSWLKYYSEEAINAPLPQCTLYQYIYDCNKTRLQKPALNYFGRKVSYGQMFSYIDTVANAFYHCGIKAGDMVSLCMLTMPETVYSVYALNRLGAICNNIEPRTNSARIKDLINKTNSTVLIVVDVFLSKILEIADETQLKNIIVVPISVSMPLHIRAGFRVTRGKAISQKPDDPRYVYWEDFLKKTEKKHISYPPYKKDTPAVIIYTGGTTGVPKGAVLSNDSITAMALQSIYDVPLLYEGSRFLGIMPPFIAYGFVFGMFIPFCAGLEIVQIPNFDPKKFADLILKYKPNHVVGVPAFFEELAKSKKVGDKRLDYLMCAITGGDQLLESSEEMINQFLHKHGCKYKILKGYGMTEMGSAASFTTTDECNLPGSIGVPTHRASVQVIDHETGEELGYNHLGELCLSGDTMMMEYYQDEKETQAVRRLHSDGKYWIHSGDIGYVNEDGVIYITGRMKRMIIRPDGHNVWPSRIEEVISRHPAVDQCAVVGLPNPINQNGKIPTAFIVINPSVKKTNTLLKEIEEFSKAYLPERDTASEFRFIDSIPMTLVGKVDFRALEDMG